MDIKEVYENLDLYDFSRILNRVISKQRSLDYNVYDAIIDEYPEIEDWHLTVDEFSDYLLKTYTLGCTEVITTYVYKTGDSVEKRK